ncbi:hypothetical protein TL08_04365 [Actinoalloteichus hymeniacidonis]|uniref:Uncharacterized protein n=1 Tax=Actinoalloteichus hymeniacidonis TaxID=340345 RepID=A0AAC9HM28_9PSEU|nr:hypothetical protein TL08_04365 [Actinoalloteichus hymeniacidonis]
MCPVPERATCRAGKAPVAFGGGRREQHARSVRMPCSASARFQADCPPPFLDRQWTGCRESDDPSTCPLFAITGAVAIGLVPPTDPIAAAVVPVAASTHRDSAARWLRAVLGPRMPAIGAAPPLDLGNDRSATQRQYQAQRQEGDPDHADEDIQHRPIVWSTQVDRQRNRPCGRRRSPCGSHRSDAASPPLMTRLQDVTRLWRCPPRCRSPAPG